MPLILGLNADNLGIFKALGKNKHHPGLEGIASHYSTNCTTKRDLRQETGSVRQETGGMRRET